MKKLTKLIIPIILAILCVTALLLTLGNLLKPKVNAENHEVSNTKELNKMDYEVYFNERISDAQHLLQSDQGKEYEKIFRESTWAQDHSCFSNAAEHGGAIGYYQLVAIINEDGSASNVEFRPNHTYSECMYNWFLKKQIS